MDFGLNEKRAIEIKIATFKWENRESLEWKMFPSLESLSQIFYKIGA